MAKSKCLTRQPQWICLHWFSRKVIAVITVVGDFVTNEAEGDEIEAKEQYEATFLPVLLSAKYLQPVLPDFLVDVINCPGKKKRHVLKGLT